MVTLRPHLSFCVLNLAVPQMWTALSALFWSEVDNEQRLITTKCRLVCKLPIFGTQNVLLEDIAQSETYTEIFPKIM
jgi:hypothetical protein